MIPESVWQSMHVIWTWAAYCPTYEKKVFIALEVEMLRLSYEARNTIATEWNTQGESHAG